MRFRIRAAKIPKEDRTRFERFGVLVVSLVLTTGFHPAPSVGLELNDLYDKQATGKNVRDWLLEQHDIEERRETWSLLMEMAITCLVASELLFSILAAAGHEHWLRDLFAVFHKGSNLR